jgi:uncharacterized membrane protein HdeD (DUF308 family)
MPQGGLLMSDYTIEEAFGESKLPWWFLLLDGAIAIIVGILLLMNPDKMSVMLVQVLAIYWLIKGIVSIVSIFIDHSAWGWKLLIGIVGIIAVYILIEHPLGGTATDGSAFVIVLGIQGILIGIIELVQAYQGRGWGVGILGGLTTIIGVWLLLNAWAEARVLPWVLGILAIFVGIVAIVFSVRLKRAADAAALAVPVDEVDEKEVPPVEKPVILEDAPEEEAPAEVRPIIHDTPDEEAKSTHEVSFIEGIGPMYGEALKDAGVETPMSLLEAGATPSGRKELAEKTEISSKLILTWVNHADLMRIKGVGSQFADLLEESGVDTVPDLAQRNPANLYAKIVEVHGQKGLVRRVPGLREVEAWVAEAKELPRVVRY